MSVLHEAYSWKCLKLPKNTTLMRMEQLASNHIRIPNEWSPELCSYLQGLGPQRLIPPQVYNQHIQFSRGKAESHFPWLIRHLNSQFKEKEVLFFGLEDVHQLENIGMLHPGETRHKAWERGRIRGRERERDVRSHVGDEVWIIHPGQDWDQLHQLPVCPEICRFYSMCSYVGIETIIPRNMTIRLTQYQLGNFVVKRMVKQQYLRLQTVVLARQPVSKLPWTIQATIA